MKEGRGQSTISMAPGAAINAIRAGAEKALKGDLKKSLLASARKHTILEITYGNPNLAYRHSWYPGCKHIGNRTIRFETDDYFEYARSAFMMLNYVT